jgi:hypothetical protein
MSTSALQGFVIKKGAKVHFNRDASRWMQEGFTCETSWLRVALRISRLEIEIGETSYIESIF